MIFISFLTHHCTYIETIRLCNREKKSTENSIWVLYSWQFSVKTNLTSSFFIRNFFPIDDLVIFLLKAFSLIFLTSCIHNLSTLSIQTYNTALVSHIYHCGSSMDIQTACISGLKAQVAFTENQGINVLLAIIYNVVAQLIAVNIYKFFKQD